jgi:hypothetical protein
MTWMFPVVGLLWVAVLIAYGFSEVWLRYKFKTKYPEIAAREIPHVFEPIRHPEEALFFYRQRARELFAGDPELLRCRRCLIVMAWVLGITLPGSFLILVVATRISR